MTLHTKTYGEGAPLLILHGLLGSGSNWATHAKWLADELGYQVILPDLRNHGRSPHADAHTYADLAADVAELIAERDLGPVSLAGHSMGGKVAMTLALTQPELLHRLCVIDIAPVDYPARHLDLLESMSDLDLSCFTEREAIEEALREAIPSQPVRQFVMTNLKRQGNHFAWRINLPVLRRELDTIMAFGLPDALQPYENTTLFIAGERSDYIQPEHQPAIDRWFPQAELRTIPAAGHWVHAENPTAFRKAFAGWL